MKKRNIPKKIPVFYLTHFICCFFFLHSCFNNTDWTISWNQVITTQLLDFTFYPLVQESLMLTIHCIDSSQEVLKELLVVEIFIWKMNTNVLLLHKRYCIFIDIMLGICAFFTDTGWSKNSDTIIKLQKIVILRDKIFNRIPSLITSLA